MDASNSKDLKICFHRFMQRWQIRGEFHQNFLTAYPYAKKEKAIATAYAWFHFSSFMPKLLSLASYRVSSNKIRERIVKVLLGELGHEPGEYQHPDMFLDAVYEIGVNKEKMQRFATDFRVTTLLEKLERFVLESENDQEILGLLLGLEMPAIENIETLIKALSFNPEVNSSLSNSEFFKVHFKNEDDHIEINLKNYISFCEDLEKRESFLKGFDTAISFWENFWTLLIGLTKEQIVEAAKWRTSRITELNLPNFSQ